MRISYTKKISMFLLIFLNSVFVMHAQQTGFKGKIVDAITNESLQGVMIRIEGTSLSSFTDAFGEFSFEAIQLPLGEQVASISKSGYVTQRYPITINEGRILDIKVVSLQYDVNQEQLQIGTISLADNELDQEEGVTDNISGLLQSSRDVFLNAAAFDFSAAFFRPRGLDNADGKVLINGIEMNKLSNGRPQWANWGGLNDVQRNREFTMGLTPNEYTFGGLAGTTNIVMRASQYRKGGRVSYSVANRSYTGRIMGSYSSGMMQNGWAYSFLASRRFGDEGFIDGTFYDANSFFAAIEKKINDKHSINLTSFYAPNRRGRSTAITREVYDLKGRKYNPNWGYQDGEKRNSRIREIEEPVLMLNHYWTMSDKVSLNTNIAYQTGKIGNSRIESRGTTLGSTGDFVFGDASNPSPDYFRNLPSFYLQDANPSTEDLANAYLAEQAFLNDGQLDWNSLYLANQNNAGQGYNSTYILYEDRTDDTQISANTILNATLTDHISLNGSASYTNLKSKNFAKVLDLLGGSGYLDVNAFASDADENFSIDRAQNDVANPNRIVGVGDTFRYNYEIDAEVISGFAQAQFKYNLVDFYVGANVSQTSYQRTGLYENGRYLGNASVGKSRKLDFTNYGAKAGFTFKIDGRNLIDVNGAYYTKAPTIRNAFTNARENNVTVGEFYNPVTNQIETLRDPDNEKIKNVDVSYIFRSPIVKARLTGYYNESTDGTDISFFFTNGLGSFVQEVLTNVDERRIGGELGIEAQVTPTIKLKAVAAVGQNTYTNNPDIEVTSDDANFIFPGGLKSNLKDYHVASGPERAYQVGFEYRDPNFWWVGVTANHFSNTYLDISPLTRSEAFPLNLDDPDQLPYTDYDPAVARELLRQEQFDAYTLVNAVGGKSWKIGDYFVGVFAGINNIFNERYITGGFEQSRNSDYRNALEESQRDTPLFGPRYFFGQGTNYFVNLSLRF